MRNTQLTRSQQVIISAVISAAVRWLIVMLIVLYQSLTGAWTISTKAMFSTGVVAALAFLLTEIIQTFIASEQIQRWKNSKEGQWSFARGNTAPIQAVPPTPRNKLSQWG